MLSCRPRNYEIGLMRVSDDHDFDLVWIFVENSVCLVPKALEKGGFVMSEEPHILNANAEEELLFLFDRQRSREKGLAG
ncbi:hypothetical protein RchiOBHm_Chr1g0336571 [Rosa chinensis]|uniref:Uncharacterized protein n=1 Tax=Rosa chinensis TaxID=74649 RepID=A0A2P6SCP9_ROSCH|nr:hypothetical protein RchiOBHm_Chr1g0336571 [Rosa chinensis]